jgi:hypothetical protein
MSRSVFCFLAGNILSITVYHSRVQHASSSVLQQDRKRSLFNESSPDARERSLTITGKGGGFLPTIFIAGGQKCGSSSLFELLTQHPQILKVKHVLSVYFYHMIFPLIRTAHRITSAVNHNHNLLFLFRDSIKRLISSTATYSSRRG